MKRGWRPKCSPKGTLNRRSREAVVDLLAARTREGARWSERSIAGTARLAARSLLLACSTGLAVAAAQVSLGDAPLLPTGLLESRIAAGEPTLWWRLPVEGPERIEIDLEILEPGLDLDLYLHQEAELPAGLPVRPPPIAWHQSVRAAGIAHERIVAVVAPGLYTVAIHSPRGGAGRFRLLVGRESVEPEAVPSASESRPLERGIPVRGVVDYDLGPREEWWHFEVSTPGAMAVDLAGDFPAVDLNLSIHRADRPGVTLAVSERGRSSLEVVRLWTSPGRYLVRVWAHSSGNASGYQLTWRGVTVEEVSGPDAIPERAQDLGRGSGPRWIDVAGNRTDWWRVESPGQVRYHGPPGVTLSLFTAGDFSRTLALLDGSGLVDTPAGAYLRVQAGPGAAGTYELTVTTLPPAPDGGLRPSAALSVESSAVSVVSPEARTAWFRIDWAGGRLRVNIDYLPGSGEVSAALTDAGVLRFDLPGYFANLREPLASAGSDGGGRLILARDLPKGVYFVAVFLHSSEPVLFEVRVGR